MYEQSFIDHVIFKHPQHAARRVVETGTCSGYSTRRLSQIYQQVDTVELGEDLAEKTRISMEREGHANVRFHVGDSAQVLRAIVGEIHEPCVFYLDAHWSGDETVDWNASEWKGYGVPTAHRGTPGQRPSSEEQVPLLAEMQVICETFPQRAIIYIDDFALFGADGRGRTDVGFVGNDWSNLHVDDLKRICKDRLVDWIVDGAGRQVAIVLAATHGTEGAEAADVEVQIAAIMQMRAARAARTVNPLLGLVMIVKNEAARIVEVLRSYLPYIDHYTILDTGSSDGTQDLIRHELAGIPGSLYEEPFVDFATSRNRALELHGQSTVFTIMPNGDTLQGGGSLRSFLEAHRHDYAGAYRVRIAPGHYYHPLVMRAGAGWKYRWRTHECAQGPDLGDQIPDVLVVRDRGSRTDAEWRARWMRDLDLLGRDLVDDPNDPRPYFYLGQTHECLGQHVQALSFFEQRAKMGGYFDEVYESKFRVAKMKQAIERPWAEIQQAYLDAHAHDPRRAEPLHAIAEHWHDKDLHALTRIFATAAAKLPKPPTDLFLDEAVYSWRAADLAAISSYYAGHKEDGRYFAELAVRSCPNDERLRANRAFYARSAGEMFGGLASPRFSSALARSIDFQPEPGWNVSNPSICRGPDGLRCIVRTVNYKITDDGKYATPPEDVVREDGQWRGWQVIRTRNFILDLDDDLRTTRSVELVDTTDEARSNYPVHGFEDMRLFAWKGKWWATSTVCDFTEEGRREIALLAIDDVGAITHAVPMRGNWSHSAQKNWMPFVEGDLAKIVYAMSPTPTIIDLIDFDGNGFPTVLFPTEVPQNHGRLRGGSQGVRIDSGWIFVIHDVAFPGSGRMYLHRFVHLNEHLELVAMTDLFYFERLGIEFCAGLALVGDKLVASYSVNDGSARLGVFDLGAIQKALRTDFVI